MTSFSSLAGRLPAASSNPVNPIVGDEYFNTVSNSWMRWDGAQWRGIALLGSSTSTTTTSTSTTTTSTSSTTTSTSSSTTTSTSTSTTISTTSTSTSTTTTV